MVIILLLIHSFMALSQPNEKPTLVVFYFGATSCGPCNRPEVIESVKKIKTEFSQKYPAYNAKFVMVSMDKDINEGIFFLKKYDLWDEVSIGSHYQNELVLSILSKSKIPGVPHVFVFKDLYAEAKGVAAIKERQLVADILGGKQIVEWVQKGFQLKVD